MIKKLMCALEQNQSAVERFLRTADECLGVEKKRLPEPIKKVDTSHQNFARSA